MSDRIQYHSGHTGSMKKNEIRNEYEMLFNQKNEAIEENINEDGVFVIEDDVIVHDIGKK